MIYSFSCVELCQFEGLAEKQIPESAVYIIIHDQTVKNTLANTSEVS